MSELHRKRSDIDLLLFDLDGTLVDSVPQLYLAVDAALQGFPDPPQGERRVNIEIAR